MYFMGMFEFRQYMNAADKLREIQEEQKMIIQRAYTDIHPTRVHYDYERGRMFSESLNVADYAIWLIEMKESHSKHRAFWERRAAIFESAKASLSEEELHLFDEVRSNMAGLGRAHRAVIENLKKCLERIVSNQSSVDNVAKSVTPIDDVEEWDRKVEAMSNVELLEGYQDQIEVCL